tara:strand:+ start:5120 stop:5500 length:381 start_codon:yes stop_codon:yes gene_type:complete
MDISGKIKTIGDTNTFGEKGFRKRIIVITTDEQYPQHIPVEFVQDKSNLLDPYQVGQDVKISINLRGNEWNKADGTVQNFLSAQGWRIEPTGSAPVQAPQEAQSQPAETFEPASDMNEEDHDDLPF